jgi:hypothetical protein
VTTNEAAPGDAPPPPAPAPAPAAPATGGIPRKTWLWIGGVTLAVWAFAINTGNTIVLMVAGVLTAVLIGVLLWAMRTIRKHHAAVSLLQGSMASPEARREALAKLSQGKDATTPTNLLARSQLMAADDPKGALALLGSIGLKAYPPAMQDDVSLIQTQLHLSMGHTAEARRAADRMNLDNPQRKEVRALAATLVALAWARTGKPIEALALLDTIELPKKDGEQIAAQAKIARIFARFAARQRDRARTELVALAEEDPNQLGYFIQPQFRVHPELKKLAESVFAAHPGARRQIKAQTRRR